MINQSFVASKHVAICFTGNCYIRFIALAPRSIRVGVGVAVELYYFYYYYYIYIYIYIIMIMIISIIVYTAIDIITSPGGPRSTWPARSARRRRVGVVLIVRMHVVYDKHTNTYCYDDKYDELYDSTSAIDR